MGIVGGRNDGARYDRRLDRKKYVCQLSDMTTTAREFTRNFREIRTMAARGKTVRVTAPEGVYLFQREKSHKTCGSVLAGLTRYRGKGFLTEGGIAALVESKQRPVLAKSPWDEA
jgi:hypothetical protein